MNILEWAARISKDQKLEFLVIGGHAVNAYGYARETSDVDFLVRKEDRSGWEAAFVSIGYTIFRDAPTFLQLSAPEGSPWPVDLMFVNDRTFQSIRRSERNGSVSGPHQDSGGRTSDRSETARAQTHPAGSLPERFPGCDRVDRVQSNGSNVGKSPAFVRKVWNYRSV